MNPRSYLREDRIVAAIDKSHLCQAGFAEEIGRTCSPTSRACRA